MSQQAQGAASPEAALSSAWRLAQQIGQYRYDTTIAQTQTPALTLANAGLGPRSRSLFVQGSLDREQQALSFKMWGEAGGALSGNGAIEVKVENGQAYGRLAGSGWEKLEASPAEMFAPGGSPLGFLQAARDVRRVDEQNSGQANAYTFTIDGPAYARLMQAQLEDNLRRQGKLPVGLQLGAAEAYRQMNGQGQVWLDAAGRPQRLVIEADFPAGSNGATTARIQTDFSGWGALPAGANLGLWLQQAGKDVAGNGTAYGLVGLLALITAAALWQSQRKGVYAAVVGVVVFSMVATPLLEGGQAAAFYDEQRQMKQAQEQKAVLQQAQAGLRAEEQAERRAFDPHQNPLAQAPAAAGNAPTPGGMATGIAGVGAAPLAPTAETITSIVTITFTQFLPAQDDGSDDDGDGLTNYQEIWMGTNRANPDSDGDGLSDGVEVHKLGTEPAQADTDGDGLPDGKEVAGFSLGGQMWYLDPQQGDSNDDGIADGVECDYDADTQVMTCADSNGDGRPDVFESDNDHDGVPDGMDSDMNQAVGNLNSGLAEGAFHYQLNGATPGRPVTVDFQLRPTNPEHLWYSTAILDWPANDKDGQVRRVFDTTLADFGTGGDSALLNGDMRLIPVLEIEIPFQAGGYANLPVKAGAPAITPDTPLGDWLDEQALQAYGISVRRKDQAGTLLAYVPLTVQRDMQNNTIVAFSGRMFYQAGAAWGQEHTARLVWLVQSITDSCMDVPGGYEPGLNAQQRLEKWCADLSHWQSNGPQVIHTYNDAWYLTGLRIREDRGVKMAVVYEDPAYTISQPGYNPTGFHDDNLWALAQGLESSFLAGRGVAEGTRDFTFDDIAARFDQDQNGASTPDQRWGIPQNALQVQSYAFEHEALAMAVPMTYTKQILEQTFSPQIGYLQDPLFLYAAEENARSLSLLDQPLLAPLGGGVWQNGVLQDNGLAFDMDINNIPVATTTSVRWAPYRYNSGAWESYPVKDYYEAYQEKWKQTLSAAYPDPDELQGALIVNSAYFISVFQGSSGLAAVNGLALPIQAARTDADIRARLALAAEKPLPGLARRWQEDMLRLQASLLRSSETVAHLFVDKWMIGKGGLVYVYSSRFIMLSSLSKLYQSQMPISNTPRVRGVYDKRGVWVKQNVSSLTRGIYKGTRVLMRMGSGAFVTGMGLAVLQTAAVFDRANMAPGAAGALDIIAASVNLALNAYNFMLIGGQFYSFFVLRSVYYNNYTAAANLKNIWNLGQQTMRDGISVSKVMGAMGMILSVAVSFGVFLYEMISSKTPAFSLSFDLALANTVATILVSVLLLAIGAIPLIGQLFVALVALIDAVINFACALINRPAGSPRPEWCAGVTGYLVKAVQFVLYDQTPLINLAKDDRLNIGSFDVSLAHPEQGVQVGNALDVSLKAGTAMYKNTFDSPYSFYYGWMFADTYAKWSSFAYNLSRTQDDLHGSLAWKTMQNAWKPAPASGWGSGASFVYTTTLSLPAPLTLTQSGLNRSVPGLYLNEGSSIPVQECFYPSICIFREDKRSLHLDLGAGLVFDVFPHTLDEFRALTNRPDGGYALAWMTNVAVPALKDADGDGLRSAWVGGPDPNDSLPDSDHDGLTDFVELAQGTNPALPDADADGLNDAQEMALGTNPLAADTDKDGLSDYEETQGWSLVYAYSGATPLLTWVRSDPLDPNKDGDAYPDGLEKTYAFNPEVPNSGEILDVSSRLTSQNSFFREGQSVPYDVRLENALDNRFAFGLLQVDFPAALSGSAGLAPSNFNILPSQAITLSGQLTVDPGLSASQVVSLTNTAGAAAVDLASETAGRTTWLHLEAPVGGVFADATLQGRQASCTGSTCPASVSGLRNQGVSLDGVDDALSLAGSPNELGLANSSYTVQAWVKLPDLSGTRTLLSTPTGAAHVFALGLFGGQMGFYLDGSQFYSPAALTAGEWHRLTWRFNRFTNEHAMFVDGVKVQSSTSYTPAYDLLAQQTEQQMRLGGAAGAFGNFSGMMDEFEIFPYALSDAAVLDALGGSSGLVFYDTFEEDVNNGAPGVWNDQSAYLNSQTCAQDGNGYICPLDQVSGFVGKAMRFSNSASGLQSLLVNAKDNLALNRGSGAFSISVWLKKQQFEGGWVMGNVPSIGNLDTNYPSLRVDGDSMEAHFGVSPNRCDVSASGLSTLTDTQADRIWHHVASVFDGQTYRLYLDNQEVASTACVGKKPTIGSSFFIGNNHPLNVQGFKGDLDELRIFNYGLSPEQIDQLYWDSQPSLNLALDEAPGRTQFVDDSLLPHHAACSSIAAGGNCPVSGLQGRFNQAIRLDGVNDALSIAGADVLGLNAQSFTVSAWVKMNQFNGAQAVLGNQPGSAAEMWGVGFNGSEPTFHTPSGTLTPPDAQLAQGRWQHVVWTNAYDPATTKSQLGIFVDGTQVYSQTFTMTFNAGSSLMYLGHFTDPVDGARYISADLDEVQVFRQALSVAQVQAQAQHVPALLLHFDDSPQAVQSGGGFANAAAPGNPAACSGSACPQAGQKGRIYQAAGFDGGSDKTAVSVYDGLFSGDYTIAGWVKPEAMKGTAQTVLSLFNGSPIQRLVIQPNSLQAAWELRDASCAPGMQTFALTGELRLNTWNHVIIATDGSQVKLYLNGRLDSVHDLPSGMCRVNVLGALVAGEAGFQGALDEVAVFKRLLSDQEIAAMVDYQTAWVDQSTALRVQIDADDPNIELAATAPYLPLGGQILAVNASDPTSRIYAVNVNVNNNGWVTATLDNDVWLFNFNPGGEGSYDVQLRARDVVGHETMILRTLQVDGSGPVLGVTNAETAVGPLGAPYDPAFNSYQASLSGAITSQGSPAAEVFVTLTKDGTPVSGRLPAALGGGAWSITYPFPTAPRGAYSLLVEAYDQIGNRSERTATANIDGAAPQTVIAQPAKSQGLLFQGQVVTGTVSDTPVALSMERTALTEARAVASNDAGVSGKSGGGSAATVAYNDAGASGVEVAFRPAFENYVSSAQMMSAGLRVHLPLGDSQEAYTTTQSWTFADASEHGADVTCQNDACPQAMQAGQVGLAAGFDGVNDGLSASSILSGSLSAVTLAAWVKPQSGASDQTAVAMTTGGNLTHWLGYRPATQQFVYADAGGEHTASGAYAADAWHLVMLSIAADNSAVLYVDGAARASFTVTSRPGATSALQLGYTAVGAARRLNGALDDVALYGRSFTAEEAADYFRGWAPALHLGLDEKLVQDGGLLADSSPFNHTVTLSTGGAPASVAGLPGVVGAAMLPFDGIDDQLNVTAHPALDLSAGKYTLAGWFHNSGANGALIGNGPAGASNQAYAFLRYSGADLSTGFGDGSAYQSVTFSGVVPAGQMVFAAVTFDGTTLNVYVNGAPAGSSAALAGKLPYPATAPVIGRDGPALQTGAIDEVTIYRQALTAQQVAALYAQRWQAAALNGGEWSFPVPAGLDGLYQIQTRSTDLLGNQSFGVQDQGRWDGRIINAILNTAPSFTAGADVTVLENSGAYSATWATAISAGLPVESGQSLSFQVTGNSKPGLFAQGPVIDPNGVLSFTPAANMSGTAAITVTLQDNGGTAYGGQDTSLPRRFNIIVKPLLTFVQTPGSDPGPEWGGTAITTTSPCNVGFMGQFGSQTVTLALNDLMPHDRILVTFDLYILKSWDGNTVTAPRGTDWSKLGGLQAPNAPVGPDLWWMRADGNELLRTTFSNWTELSFRQAYPGAYGVGDYPSRSGATQVNSLCYSFGGLQMDSLYPMAFSLEHNASTLALDFGAQLTEPISDEAWGLNNVKVFLNGNLYQWFAPLIRK